jgi:hypothetical protein
MDGKCSGLNPEPSNQPTDAPLDRWRQINSTPMLHGAAISLGGPHSAYSITALHTKHQGTKAKGCEHGVSVTVSHLESGVGERNKSSNNQF